MYEQLAIDKVKTYRDEYPTRVFLLGDLYDTEFKKDTLRGLQGSKVYFDISKLDVDSPYDLACKLNGKTWSDLRKI